MKRSRPENQERDVSDYLHEAGQTRRSWRTPVLTPGRKYLVSSSRRTLAQKAESDFQLNHVLKEVETGGRPELEEGRWLRRAKDLTPRTDERKEARTLRPRRIISILHTSNL
jgi:hypothetical protein